MNYSEVFGDIWIDWSGDPSSVLVIPTNSYIRKDGTLVMGAGVARQALVRFPNIDKHLGDKLKQFGNVPFINENLRIATLPTKTSWMDPADPVLIENSLIELIKILDLFPQFSRILLPRPGCGNGKLNWDIEVKPICDRLLDNRFVVYNYWVAHQPKMYNGKQFSQTVTNTSNQTGHTFSNWGSLTANTSNNAVTIPVLRKHKKK